MKLWVTKSFLVSTLRALMRGKPCHICQLPMTHPCADHDSRFSDVRGWLCHKCNRGLGQFNDDQRLVQLAANYLLMHRTTHAFRESA
ncbi:MAG: hypothetical protein EPN91_02295 [Salinibacterium sp.]|nr:MAG: hypothetical protein EPN91_02295 [Salinibacterium sp.]